jgi:nucleoid DNA-binding protein
MISKNVKSCCSKSQCGGPIKVDKPFNKSQIINTIAYRSCVGKKDIGKIMDTLFEIIAAHLKKRSGPGEFTLPNIAKFKVINKPATKARQGINPFTGEKMTFAAKPARNLVKVRVLKKVKDVAK